MLFDPEAIQNKITSLDSILNFRELLEDVIASNIFDDYSIQQVPRVWEPGGGATLFKITTSSNKYFLKVKSSNVWVESRLESESSYKRIPSLVNEYNFIKELNTYEWVPKIIFFEERLGFHFLSMEWLESFDTLATSMSPSDLLDCWYILENAVQRLYKIGIVHTDIHENNICFRGKKIVLVDFEEARFLDQRVPFVDSLDVSGHNRYGDVGDFPVMANNIVPLSLTCLNRLKLIFRKLIKNKLPQFIKQCNFDHTCEYNLDQLQEPDSRIYQSLQIENLSITGQRPVDDRRIDLLAFLFKRLKYIYPIVHLDIGSNLGRFCFTLSKLTCVKISIGVEASKDFFQASKLIKFAYNIPKVQLYNFICGSKSLSSVASEVNLVTMFSVYHHIRNKDFFLSDLRQIKPKLLISEFATQDRFYPERGSLSDEIAHIKEYLDYKHIFKVSITKDYRRPVIIFSDRPLDKSLLIACNFIYNTETKNKLIYNLKKPLINIKKILKFIARYFKERKTQSYIDYFNIYNKAMTWVNSNSKQDSGICIYYNSEKAYPEVTGYYIPSLLCWGDRKKALDYTKWLISLQNNDGSWSAPDKNIPYTFDTGQILKGLIAIQQFVPDAEIAIRKGCDWILTQIEPSGRIITPDKSAWGLPNGKRVSENIHLYALEPLRNAAVIFNEPHYEEAVQRALNFYLALSDLTDFNTLAHFHAYVLEALVDLGYPEVAKKGLAKIERLQRPDGSIPAYPDVKWICSTAIAQYAIVWYKLGNRTAAEKAFQYLGRLQNPSGGFYGSYGRGANYFPDQEISWAVKYFLDAYYWHIRTAFDYKVDIFPETIAGNDGRLLAVLRGLGNIEDQEVLDAGCGKGRFARALLDRYPTATLSGVDISDAMLRCIPSPITTKQGSLLNLPFSDSTFDGVFSVEALEHSVNPEMAIEELCRVVKQGGRVVVIDKNIERQGALQVESWEKWFSRDEVQAWLTRACDDVKSEFISYDDKTAPDGLFIAWYGTKR